MMCRYICMDHCQRDIMILAPIFWQSTKQIHGLIMKLEEKDKCNKDGKGSEDNWAWLEKMWTKFVQNILKHTTKYVCTRTCTHKCTHISLCEVSLLILSLEQKPFYLASTRCITSQLNNKKNFSKRRK